MTIVGANWSYSGNPATDTKDAVRFLVGDTDQRAQLISDEEIWWALGQVGNTYAAAAMCCRTIASAGGGATGSVTVGDMTQTSGMDAAAWEAKATALEAQAARAGAAPSPILGGSSIDRKRDNATDDDRTSPFFYRGMFARPGSTSSPVADWSTS